LENWWNMRRRIRETELWLPGHGHCGYFAWRSLRCLWSGHCPGPLSGNGPVKNAILEGMWTCRLRFGSLGPLIKAGNIFPWLQATNGGRISRCSHDGREGISRRFSEHLDGLFVPESLRKLRWISSVRPWKNHERPGVRKQIEQAAWSSITGTVRRHSSLWNRSMRVAKVVKKLGIGK